MSQINRVPFGLQDLLGSQNFGDNPSELSQVVAPTLDMTPFLTAERTSYSYLSLTLAANAEIGTIVVPEGELWYCLGVGSAMKANSGLPANAYGCRISAFAFNLPTSTDPAQSHAMGRMVYDEPTPAALTTPQYQYASFEFPVPIPIFSGSSIRFYLSGSYGITAWAVKAHVRFIKVKQ